VQSRPVIGIATQTLDANPAQQLPTCWIMGQRYVRALTAVGAVPWVIPLLPGDGATLRCIYEQLDGVFLTGGVDMDPAQYHEPRHPQCGKADPPRDQVELQLIRWAVAEHKPVLGVCRGIQVINVALGGSLYQDLGSQRPDGIKHDYFPHTGDWTRDQLIHPVRVVADTRLASILQDEQVQVNSMHHQGIKRLASGLLASAFAPDGLIEGVEGTNSHYLVGVQWHPEELAEQLAPMHALFASFLQAASAYRDSRR
jgi:putative glutamine amidotransferase